MNQESAETLSLEALAFIASDEDHLGALLAQCGWTLEDLREQISSPTVLAGILEFLLSDERRLLDFCEQSGRPPEQPAQARRALPGNWDGDVGFS